MICTIHVNNHRQLIYTLLIITLCSEVKRNQKKPAKQKKNIYIHYVWWARKRNFYRLEESFTE